MTVSTHVLDTERGRPAAGVRVDFRSPIYVDANRGPNWWTYFFTRAEMPIRAAP